MLKHNRTNNLSVSQNHHTLLNKMSHPKCIFAVAFLLLFIVAVYIYFVLIWKSGSQKNNEKLIREAAAFQLNKKVDDLTNKDFVKVTKLIIENYDTTDLLHKKVELNDIKLLEKFVNLEDLDLSNISYPEPDIPKWMVVLGKTHVFDLYKNYHKYYMKKYLIDLSPLKNLSKLQVIRLFETPIKDINPLAKLDNLREIHMSSNQLDEFGIFTGGRVPETVFISDKEYKLENNSWPILIKNKFAKETDINEVSPLPTIKYHSPASFASELQTAEMMIKFEVNKALQ